MRDALTKVWAWLKARPRWLWGVLVGALGLVVLAIQRDGAELPESERPTLPPPAPVPPVLQEQADEAAVEAERARTAPATLGADEVAAGLARHARKP